MCAAFIREHGTKLRQFALPVKQTKKASLEAPGWQQPHTFCYEPNALLRHFYPVPPPAVPKASSEGEQGGRQDTGLRYTTDDATSTEKRKERGLSTD